MPPRSQRLRNADERALEIQSNQDTPYDGRDKIDEGDYFVHGLEGGNMERMVGAGSSKMLEKAMELLQAKKKVADIKKQLKDTFKCTMKAITDVIKEAKSQKCGAGATPSMGLSTARGGSATPSMGLSMARGGVKMSKKKFVSEHTHLVDVLAHGTPAQQKKEAKAQAKELAMKRGGSSIKEMMSGLIHQTRERDEGDIHDSSAPASSAVGKRRHKTPTPTKEVELKQSPKLKQAPALKRGKYGSGVVTRNTAVRRAVALDRADERAMDHEMAEMNPLSGRGRERRGCGLEETKAKLALKKKNEERLDQWQEKTLDLWNEAYGEWEKGSMKGPMPTIKDIEKKHPFVPLVYTAPESKPAFKPTDPTRVSMGKSGLKKKEGEGMRHSDSDSDSSSSDDESVMKMVKGRGKYCGGAMNEWQDAKLRQPPMSEGEMLGRKVAQHIMENRGGRFARQFGAGYYGKPEAPPPPPKSLGDKIKNEFVNPQSKLRGEILPKAETFSEYAEIPLNVIGTIASEGAYPTLGTNIRQGVTAANRASQGVGKIQNLVNSNPKFDVKGVSDVLQTIKDVGSDISTVRNIRAPAAPQYIQNRQVRAPMRNRRGQILNRGINGDFLLGNGKKKILPGRTLVLEGGKKRRAGAKPGDGRKKRAEIVRRVMADKGMKMIEASKYVKEHKLY